MKKEKNIYIPVEQTLYLHTWLEEDLIESLGCFRIEGEKDNPTHYRLSVPYQWTNAQIEKYLRLLRE